MKNRNLINYANQYFNKIPFVAVLLFMNTLTYG